VTFNPMLASSIEDTKTLRYPVLVSAKLDGIRATVQGGKLLSRNLKPIPNIQVQKRFANLPEGLDGELIVGPPIAKDVFQKTTSVVMSDNVPADHVWFYVFDIYGTSPFEKRAEALINMIYNDDNRLVFPYVTFVTQHRVADERELLQIEEEALGEGYEGVIVRSTDGPYKQGRSTVNQGWMLKLKRFEDEEAEVVGVVEEVSNTNQATTNALGHTERSSHKAGLVGKGTLGKFEVVGITGKFKGVSFGVGSGLTAEQRRSLWSRRQALIGKVIKYKYFPVGSKDAPRFPIFLGFRDKRDM